MVATPMLMLPSCMELMAMRPPSTMVAAFTLIMLATPMMMVPDMVHTPTWDKLFISFVYPNLRSANAAPFYYGSCPYTDDAGYSSPYFHGGYTYADAAFLYGAYGNAAPFYYGSCPYTDDAGYSFPYFHGGYTYADAAFLYG